MILLVSLIVALLAAVIVILIVSYARSGERVNLLKRLSIYTDVTEIKTEFISEKFMAFVKRIAEPLASIRSAEEYDKRMRKAGLPILGAEFMVIMLISGAVVGAIVMLLTLEIKYALMAAVATMLIEDFIVILKIRRRKAAFTEQLGDCLNTLADALRAGFSFPQAMEIVSREMEPPISDEFKRVLRDMSTGVQLERAIEDMDKRVESHDFGLIVTAVIVQRQVGGNLAQILENISNTVQERIRMKREAKTLTAQGRSTAKIISAMPFVMVGVIYFFMPEHLDFFREDPIGRMAAVGALISEIVGIIAINKIVDIDA